MSLRGTKQPLSFTDRITVRRDCRAVARNDIFFLVLLILCLSSIAQKSQAQYQYDNRVYRPGIKTIQFYNTTKEGAFPIINLNSNDQLLLSFDDLSANTRTYNYTIEHCDAEWNPSRISPTEYLQSYNEDRIIDYRYSVSTIQKYIHYELKLPNRNIAPKIPGNYLLKVYENGDTNNPILTRRFYVVNSRATVAAQIVPSNDVQLRQTNQKINFQVNFNGMTIQNPYGDVRILVMQNGRSETAQLNTRPTYIRGSSLDYSDVGINDFAGGNEFRHVDTRSLRLNSERTARIFRDTVNTVLLLADRGRDQDNYLTVYDNNGNFFVRNQEGSDPLVDADYAQIYFNLGVSGSTADNSVYVVGKFNDYVLDQHSKMDFDAVKGRYFFNTLLKQGIIDYQYILVNKGGKPDYTILEGNHFETENDYQILVYYRQPGARWEELVGYLSLNTTKR